MQQSNYGNATLLVVCPLQFEHVWGIRKGLLQLKMSWLQETTSKYYSIVSSAGFSTDFQNKEEEVNKKGPSHWGIIDIELLQGPWVAFQTYRSTFLLSLILGNEVWTQDDWERSANASMPTLYRIVWPYSFPQKIKFFAGRDRKVSFDRKFIISLLSQNFFHLYLLIFQIQIFFSLLIIFIEYFSVSFPFFSQFFFNFFEDLVRKSFFNFELKKKLS